MRIKNQHGNSGKKKSLGLILTVLTAVMFLVMTAAACTGSASIPFMEAVRLLAAKLPLIGKNIDLTDISSTHQMIVYQVRMPRIVLSGLTGMALSLTGAAFQGLFRNPLADPHILGVSSGAALGATAAMLSGISVRFFGLGFVGICAFAGGLVTVFVVYRIACAGSRVQTMHLLLTGTAISSLLSAVISLLMTRNREQLEKVYLWTLGSFSAATWGKVVFLLIVLLAGGLVLLLMSRELNLLAIGEDAAGTLGVPIKRVRLLMILAGTFLVSGAVAVSGVIGFVGLIIPHCVRLVIGANHQRLLPCAMLTGAVFLILCDTLARTVSAPSELPVGVVTSLFGAPYFIFLLYRDKKGKGV